MDSLIFRNDDVSCNSTNLNDIYTILVNKFSDCIIYSCSTVFSKNSVSGSIYPNLPLKDKELKYFYEVDKAKDNIFMAEKEYENIVIASHGLWHFDHTSVDRQLKEASIITSCNLLKTNIFVPPFNKWDAEVELICAANNITLIKSNEEGWKSFEHNKFDASYPLWYFHSWRWTHVTLKEYLNV